MNTALKLALTIALGLSMTSVALADDAHHASASSSEGEIRTVNKGTGKVTIKHGELKNLDMPPMTMVFRVKDPAMLEQVKAGDKISFVADRVDGQITVTKMDVMK
ncbi:MAG: copper-binding protein [Noviherbaspirillum sp.]